MLQPCLVCLTQGLIGGEPAGEGRPDVLHLAQGVEALWTMCRNAAALVDREHSEEGIHL